MIPLPEAKLRPCGLSESGEVVQHDVELLIESTEEIAKMALPIYFKVGFTQLKESRQTHTATERLTFEPLVLTKYREAC